MDDLVPHDAQGAVGRRRVDLDRAAALPPLDRNPGRIRQAAHHAHRHGLVQTAPAKLGVHRVGDLRNRLAGNWAFAVARPRFTDAILGLGGGDLFRRPLGLDQDRHGPGFVVLGLREDERTAPIALADGIVDVSCKDKADPFIGVTLKLERHLVGADVGGHAVKRTLPVSGHEPVDLPLPGNGGFRLCGLDGEPVVARQGFKLVPLFCVDLLRRSLLCVSPLAVEAFQPCLPPLAPVLDHGLDCVRQEGADDLVRSERVGRGRSDVESPVGELDNEQELTWLVLDRPLVDVGVDSPDLEADRVERLRLGSAFKDALHDPGIAGFGRDGIGDQTRTRRSGRQRRPIALRLAFLLCLLDGFLGLLPLGDVGVVLLVVVGGGCVHGLLQLGNRAGLAIGRNVADLGRRQFADPGGHRLRKGVVVAQECLRGGLCHHDAAGPGDFLRQGLLGHQFQAEDRVARRLRHELGISVSVAVLFVELVQRAVQEGFDAARLALEHLPEHHIGRALGGIG